MKTHTYQSWYRISENGMKTVMSTSDQGPQSLRLGEHISDSILGGGGEGQKTLFLTNS